MKYELSGWLIENRRGPKPRWASFSEGGVVWTDDPNKACLFARREDAEQLAFGEERHPDRVHLGIVAWVPKDSSPENKPCATET